MEAKYSYCLNVYPANNDCLYWIIFLGISRRRLCGLICIPFTYIIRWSYAMRIAMHLAISRMEMVAPFADVNELQY